MLLDPTEEQLHSPTSLVESRNGQSWQNSVVGQKEEIVAVLGIEIVNAAQGGRIMGRRGYPGEDNRLVGSQPRRWVDGVRVSPLKLRVRFGPCDKERSTLREDIKAGKIQVTPIEDVKGARFGQQLIENIDVVYAGRSEMNKGRNAAAQVEEGMQLDRALAPPKASPGEKVQTQIDGGGIEGIGGLLLLCPEVLVGIQRPSLANQNLSQVGIDAPVAALVGVGQSVARHAAAESHVVELRFDSEETSLDVSQALPSGELGKSKAEELIEAGKAEHFVLAPLARDP